MKKKLEGTPSSSSSKSKEVKTMDNPYYDTLHNELLEKYHDGPWSTIR